MIIACDPSNICSYTLAEATSLSTYENPIEQLTSLFPCFTKKMAQPQDTKNPMYDTKTIIFRSLTVLVYVGFGSGIFHVLEKDEAAREVAKFEEYYNETMTSMLGRYVANVTQIKIIMAEIRKTFLHEVFPKEWDITGGINITTQAITTVG